MRAKICLVNSRSRATCMIACVVVALTFKFANAESPATLTDSKRLNVDGDLSALMVEGIDRALIRMTRQSVAGRAQFWNRDHSSASAYEESVKRNRQRFRAVIGAIDDRVDSVSMELVATTDAPALVCETDRFRASAVRWPVFEGVWGEGLLLEPKGKLVARVVAIPDADQIPESIAGLNSDLPVSSQFARHLAEAGCEVLIPTLINRDVTWSGNPSIFMTNQTHREWIYRQGWEMGRHVIGYEVQKVVAAVDWFAIKNQHGPQLEVGIVGYGEGGLIALYSAALDTRIRATLVSGYFDSRQQLWQAPIYHNVFGLLREFGDAEIASLVAPRTLIVEHSHGPRVADRSMQPAAKNRRLAAAPGELVPATIQSVRAEVERANQLLSANGRRVVKVELVTGDDGTTTGPGSAASLAAFFSGMNVNTTTNTENGQQPSDRRKEFDPTPRQKRQVEQLVNHSQRLLRRAEQVRAGFWKDADSSSNDKWRQSTEKYRRHLWKEIVGRLPDPSLPPNVRTRKIFDRPTWVGYEVMLDVWPDVFAWGYLLVPKNIKTGERRPVVVCQHGLEGLPNSVVTEDTKSRGHRAYRAYAVQLAERGFVTYAPHNPYRGETKFRQLQRKANPLKLSLYSFILGQHQQTLKWLSSLPFVDHDRIGFYGLSYGGLSALRIPALLEQYSCSICSACFNDWTRKIMALDFRSAYMFTREYEHFTFNLGSTFNHAEHAYLIAPRPFMVERGHRDGVAPDEWVAYEFAKVRRKYSELKVPGRAEIEFFDGGHVINGQASFRFLHRHLNWPQPKQSSRFQFRTKASGK